MRGQSNAGFAAILFIGLIVVLLIIAIVFMTTLKVGASPSILFISPILPPPPPSCYCENITFLTCHDSGGCMWNDGGCLTWRPWTTFSSPLQYAPPVHYDIYLPVVIAR